jgi:hypothetical protein
VTGVAGGAGAGSNAGARVVGEETVVVGATVVGSTRTVVVVGAAVVTGMVVVERVAAVVDTAGVDTPTGVGVGPFTRLLANRSSTTVAAALTILCRTSQVRFVGTGVGGGPPCGPHPSGVGPYCCVIAALIFQDPSEPGAQHPLHHLDHTRT